METPADAHPTSPTSQPHQIETAASLYAKLQEFYWKYAAREVRNMILFYNVAKDSEFYWGSHSPLAGDNFNNLFKTWTTGQRAFSGREFDTSNLAADAAKRAERHDQVDSPEYRCARYLLQSSGFLDVDILVEPTSNKISKYQGISYLNPEALDLKAQPMVECLEMQDGPVAQPQTETNKIKVWVPVLCDLCQNSIRTPLYFQCTRGCVTSPVFPCHVLLHGKRKKLTSLEAYQELGIPSRPRRLCLSCIKSSAAAGDCEWDHMNCMEDEAPVPVKDTSPFSTQNAIRSWHSRMIMETTGISGVVGKRVGEVALVECFQKWLSEYESLKPQPMAGQLSNYMALVRAMTVLDYSIGAFGIGAFGIGAFGIGAFGIGSTYWQLLRGMAETLVQRAVPSGFVHLCFMFGPLVIESGTKGSRRGCLISPRPLPSLLWDQKAVLSLVDGWDYGKSAVEHGCLTLYEDRETKDRVTKRDTQDTENKQILGSVKQVYGGAFSGYLEDGDEEKRVISIFMQQAARYRRSESKRLQARRKILTNAAEVVTEAVKRSLEGRVKRHLWRLAQTLMETKLAFNSFTQNCQSFVDQLLRGQSLEAFFPGMATRPTSAEKAAEKDPGERPLRYLMSFGDRLIPRYGETQQQNSMITAFFLNSSTHYDVIEFVDILLRMQALRSKGSNSSHDGQSVNTQPNWDELLLRQKPCTTSGDPPSQLNTQLVEMLWLFPRDTLSMLQSHLLRPYHAYRSLKGGILNQHEWVTNRLRAMRQLDMFASAAGSLGAALVDVFNQQTALLEQVVMPYSLIYGLVRADERIRTIKVLGSVCHILLGRETPDWISKASDEVMDLFLRKLVPLCHKVFNNERRSPAALSYQRLKKNLVEKILDNIPDAFAFLLASALGLVHLRKLESMALGTKLVEMCQVFTIPFARGGAERMHLAIKWAMGLTVVFVNYGKTIRAKPRRKALISLPKRRSTKLMT
ncbi:hypothetical protein B0T10DRAFT_609556 [Thelonectria olida]|uniref:Uncharacterized protein n=1 Tax=Thelonectria olida TaxID=1576542 RepID=A0A9P8VVD5_9HYPO|nr:hypothetical protein B0T10DRAFT_609556 [Thelonectria olida]